MGYGCDRMDKCVSSVSVYSTTFPHLLAAIFWHIDGLNLLDSAILRSLVPKSYLLSRGLLLDWIMVDVFALICNVAEHILKMILGHSTSGTNVYQSYSQY